MNKLMNDRITIVKSDGQRSDSIPAVVSKDQIITETGETAVEEGDHVLRQLPNGILEDYLVLEATFYKGDPRGGIDDFYELTVRKQTSLRKDGSTAQNIGAIIHGNVSGGNIQSAGVSNAEMKQTASDLTRTRQEISRVLEEIINTGKSEMASQEFVRYEATVVEVKESLLESKRPSESIIKNALRTLTTLDSANGSLEFIAKMWPLLFTLINLIITASKQ